ncbi:MAG: PUA domain-containing protein [Candidatus Hodarchaeota archaeon]
MLQTDQKVYDKVLNYLTDPKVGKSPKDRNIAELLDLGIINLDKPANPTSHEVTAWVKRILGIKKAGHGGTLDPAVTGSLPIALGRATRALQVLLPVGKEYICIMKSHAPVSAQELLSVLENFQGKIYQTPPLRSNVKRRLRVRKIYKLELLEHSDSQLSLLHIECEAGTYIRKLCLHPDTQILTTNGSYPISKLYFSDNFCVYSQDKGKIIETRPSALQKITSPSKLIKIKMESGISFTITPDHPLLRSTENGYIMSKAENLEIGDYLVKSLNFPDNSQELIVSDLLDEAYLIQQDDIKQKCKEAFIEKYGSIRLMNQELKIDRKTFLKNSKSAITINHLKLAGIYPEVKRDIYRFKTSKGKIIEVKGLNEEFFYLLGLIASDGNNTKEKNTVRYTRIKFHNEERELIDKFLNIYQNIFPNFTISEKEVKAGFWELDANNSFLATVAASFGIKSPKIDSDLSPILNIKRKLLKSFLRGYFDGDGSVFFGKTRKNYKTRIGLFTVNEKEAYSLHKMLLKVGIANRIFTRRRIKNDKKSIIYEISIGNIASEKLFINEIGTYHPKKAKIFSQIKRLEHKRELNDHYYIGLHYKEEIRKSKSKLAHKMGGNLSRVITSKIPPTRYFYKKILSIIDLLPLDGCIIEKVKDIQIVNGTNYVYDMTVPRTHNFLIESGYISSNCHDIGLLLGTGAHMQELRRTRTGPFFEQTCVTLQDLSDAWYYYKKEGDETFIRKIIQPIEVICQNLPKIFIRDSAVDAICHGAALTIPGVIRVTEGIEKNSLTAILTMKGELVAFAQGVLSTREILEQSNGICAHTKTVFMEKKTYPSMWKQAP